MQQRLVWLASYPKSGNTWVRLFLEAYRDHGQRLDINDLNVTLHAGGRDLFDRVIGLEASELTPAEIERYRPDVYRQLAVETDEPLFIKVHDRWRLNADGDPVFPPDVTAVAICIVRDPRGVAPSFANHYNVTVDEAIGNMADPKHQLAASTERLSPQLHQPLGSWSGHVTSWLDQTDLPVHLVRYEDLHAQPVETFTGILRVAGLPVDNERVAAALDASRFDRLQAQESESGFKERLIGTPRFFRRGQADGWRDELTSAQIKRIVADHRAVMERLGYLGSAA